MLLKCLDMLDDPILLAPTHAAADTLRSTCRKVETVEHFLPSRTGLPPGVTVVIDVCSCFP